MWRGLRGLVGQILSKAPDGVAAGYSHPGGDYDPSRDALALAALAERERLADGRLPPAGIVPPAPRRTPAQERKRIDDMPIP